MATDRETGADAGQILPLAIGYSAVALTVIFMCVAVSSLYLTEKQLYALSDSTALAAADSFRPDVTGGPKVVLTDDGVRSAARDYLTRIDASDSFDDLRVGGATGSPDGHGARVILVATWHPPLLSVFVPGGVSIDVTSIARGGLRLD
ncbi:hypothetical protein [Spelaeicoccus albus]|uniref:Putative Flp pilus-assembly TadG-like N-terminal domain-containing protein n=1 Tax=Spelaeicoccus albus TaxID=1280376 RepID=A0A7Z0D5H0_9MICO|nr:hypothetical protein [Spelaeicoccus albus]NYI69266.1 hypothetical protein [Spelaeicoccus albus]